MCLEGFLSVKTAGYLKRSDNNQYTNHFILKNQVLKVYPPVLEEVQNHGPCQTMLLHQNLITIESRLRSKKTKRTF